MSYKSGPEDLQLADYTGVLKRRWWLIVAVTIIGILGSIGYFKVAHKVYIATAAVYVTATSGTANQVANGRTSGAVNLDTEAQVVQSAAVAQAAAKLMHSPESLQQILSRVSVTVPANSQVLSISCQARSAVTAANCAQSFARAYLNYSKASTTAATNAQMSALQSRISALESASAKLTIEAASLPTNSSQRAAAEEQLTSDHSQLNSLNNQVAQLATELADPAGGSIISSATPPVSPASPKPLLILPSGLLAGLLIGFVLAFIVDRRDKRIRGPRDVSQLDVPVLMSLPLKKFTPELAIAPPRSRAGRDFSELAHVLTGSLGAGSHVILVAGSSSGQGASLVAANLAVALSRNQPDVILVCGNLEGSTVPGMLGLPSGPGLTDVLSDGVTAADAGQRPATVPRLQVITPGSAAGMEADDLRQDTVDRLLNSLRGAARWVVVEAPPVTSGPDVYALAHAADAAVLVTEIRRTRTDQVLSSVQHLDRMGATVLGTVLLPSPKAPGKRATPAPAPAVASNVRLARQQAPADGGAAGNAQEISADWAPSDPADDDATSIVDWSADEKAPSSLPRN